MSQSRASEPRCLACGRVLDSAIHAGPGSKTPREGDISICLYCRHIMAFGADGGLRALTDEEMRAVAGHPKLLMAIRAAKRSIE